MKLVSVVVYTCNYIWSPSGKTTTTTTTTTTTLINNHLFSSLNHRLTSSPPSCDAHQ